MSDLTWAQIAGIIGVAASAAGILNYFFGWIGKLWRWLTSLLQPRGTVETGRLLFFADQLRGSYWAAASGIAGGSGMVLTAHLEASNTATHPFRIMDARLRWWPVDRAIILVKDLRTGVHGHDYPIPKNSIVPVSINFIVTRPALLDARDAISATVILIDHSNRKHRIRVKFKGPGRP